MSTQKLTTQAEINAANRKHYGINPDSLVRGSARADVAWDAVRASSGRMIAFDSATGGSAQRFELAKLTYQDAAEATQDSPAQVRDIEVLYPRVVGMGPARVAFIIGDRLFAWKGRNAEDFAPWLYAWCQRENVRDVYFWRPDGLLSSAERQFGVLVAQQGPGVIRTVASKDVMCATMDACFSNYAEEAAKGRILVIADVSSPQRVAKQRVPSMPKLSNTRLSVSWENLDDVAAPVAAPPGASKVVPLPARAYAASLRPAALLPMGMPRYGWTRGQ